MSETLPNFERLLREALTPVEPPVDLAQRLHGTLTSLTELAVEELEAWELSAMRDPRNWVRPAAALVVGSSAGAALILLRARQRQQQHAASALHGARDTAQRTMQDLGHETRRLFGGR